MTDKGSVGSVEFSDADGVFFGKVQGGRSLILYEAINEQIPKGNQKDRDISSLWW